MIDAAKSGLIDPMAQKAVSWLPIPEVLRELHPDPVDDHLGNRLFQGRQTIAENAPDGLHCVRRQLGGRGFVAGHHLISRT